MNSDPRDNVQVAFGVALVLLVLALAVWVHHAVSYASLAVGR